MIAILAVWLGLSAICQIDARIVRWIRGKDALLLIPRWTLFAPNPVDRDLELLVRDHFSDGTAAAWQLVQLENLPCIPVLWSPAARRRKGLEDLCSRLVQTRTRYGAQTARRSFAYSAIAALTEQVLPRAYGTSERQFAVVAIEMRHSASPAVTFLFKSSSPASG